MSPLPSLQSAAALIVSGLIGVLPTDTVYGVVAQASDPAAVAKLYALKHRESKPGTLIAANVAQLLALGVDAAELKQVEEWWPGPVSAVLAMRGNAYLHQNVGDIAMRVAANPAVVQLLELTGPLLTSSANLPSQPPATTIAEAYAYFGDAVDFYVDGGTIANTLPSTIIRPAASGIEVLRQGSTIINIDPPL
jgi:tRNA threonylcarbamoyl adenosine modification protein (Sua5/YciO/YrdC/YwlC family)